MSEFVTMGLARAHAEPTWLCRASGLSADQLAPLLPAYMALAQRIVVLRAQRGGALTVGLQGPQGAGKSTLVGVLACVLRDLADLTVACLSIDDLYLTRAERAALAEQVHPLLRTRGVPGTHDVALGVRTLTALTRPGATPLVRFDKARDDRAPDAEWPTAIGPCDVVLFEGLWIGLPAIATSLLREPINAFEAREDPHGVWRGYANQALAQRYPELFQLCDWLVHIQVPDFACVRRWRTRAEHAMRDHLQSRGADPSRVMDDAALARFFDHYERFTRHAMSVMPALADMVLRIDADQRVIELAERV